MDDKHLRIIVTLVICFLLIYWGVKENAQPSLIPVIMLVVGSLFFKGNKDEEDNAPKPKKSPPSTKRRRKRQTESEVEPPTVPPTRDYLVGIEFS